MKRIFICSPYRAKSEEEQKQNIEYARALSRQVIEKGDAPYTPHLYLTDVLDDADGAQRKKGIAAGLAFMEVCDEVLVGDVYGVSAGMRKEIIHAKRKGIPVKFCKKQFESVTFSTGKRLPNVTFSRLSRKTEKFRT